MQRGKAARMASLLLCALLFLLPFSGLATANTPEYSRSKPDLLLPEHLRAASAIVMDADTGEVLFEKNATDTRYPASTTKIMTVMLGLVNGDLESTVTMTETAAQVPEDSSTIPLEVGRSIRFADLLYATMISSGNEGANLIAEVIAGTQSNFVDMMNQTAMNLGATSTHFANPHGYHDEMHVTTAKDLALIAKAAMTNEEFRKIAALSSYSLPAAEEGGKAKRLTSKDVVFKVKSEDAERQQYFYDFATGIKTGYHSQAGYCYVGAASKNGVNLISVVLKSSSYDRAFLDTIRLMEYGFSQYTTTTIGELYAMRPQTVDISGFDRDDVGFGRLELALEKLEPETNDTIVTFQKGLQGLQKEFTRRTTVEFTRTLEAPISRHEEIGILTYTPAEGEPMLYRLVASRDVLRRPSIAPTIEEIKAFIQADPNPFPAFSLRFVLLILLPLLLIGLLARTAYRLLTAKRKPKVVKRKVKFQTRHYQ